MSTKPAASKNHARIEEIIASLDERTTEHSWHGDVQQPTVNPDAARNTLTPMRRTAASLRMPVIRTPSKPVARRAARSVRRSGGAPTSAGSSTKPEEQ